MPREPIVWCPTKTLKFIQIYESNDFLWNPNHEEYDDNKRRQDALKEMAFTFEIDKHAVEMKILELRSVFMTEIRKMKRSFRAGGEVYVPKWFALKPLLFLLGMNRREQQWEYVPESELDQQQLFQNEILAIEAPNTTAGTPGSTSDRRAPPQRGAASRVPGRPTRRVRDERTRRLLDKYEYFGQYVAMKLKLIKRRQIRLLVQRKMNSILQKAESGKYNRYGADRVVLPRAIIGPLNE